MSSVGWATLDVIPSFKDFGKRMESGTARAMTVAGADGGKRFGSAAAAASASAFSSDVDLGDGARRAGEAGGETAGKSFGETAAAEGGDSFTAKAGSAFKKGGLVAGAAAGVAFAFGMGSAIQRGALEDKLAAQLGLGAKRSKEIGEVSGALYAGAYGDSMESVNDAIRGVMSNLDGFRKTSSARLEDVTAKVLDLNAAFDEQPEAITRAASQMVRTGLADSAEQALNIITRGFQAGADKSQDLLDTFNEYGTQFRKLGLNGKKATGLLSQGLQGGARDADIVADSLKEFSLRTMGELTKTMQTSDGPVSSLTALGEAFRAAGFDALDADPKVRELAGALQQDIASGGKGARDGLQALLDGLRDTKDPLERNRNAVALFGTQAEDMGDALLALDPSNAERTLGKVGDAAERMGDKLNDNASVRIEEFRRTMQTKFIDFFANKVIPVLEDDVLPAVERFADWFEKDGGPAMQDFADDVKPVVAGVKDLVGFLNDLPGPAKLAGLGALIGGGAAIKVRGGSGGALGTAGKALGLAKPVPVFVTNKGFGAGGGGAGVVPDGDGKKTGGRRGAGVAGLLAGIFSPQIIDEIRAEIMFPITELNRVDREQKAKPLVFETQEGAVAFLDAAQKKADGFGATLDLIGGKKVEPLFAVPGLAKGREGLAEFIRLQIDAGKPVTPYINTTSIERAIALARTLDASLPGNSNPNAGVDNGAGYMSGGTGTNGRAPTIGTVNIQAHDYNDFLTQAQRRTQQAGLGGFN